MTAMDLSTHGIWRDPSVPPAERVRDLMRRMTLAEKVAQLSELWVGIESAEGTVTPYQHELAGLPADWETLIADGVGQLTRVYGTAKVDPVEGARGLAEVQRQIMAASRFGIPAQVHEECLTGLAAWQAPIFPSPLSWGASFDPDLVREMGAAIGATMRRLGVHQGLAPVLDVTRVRTEETIGEDPFLVGMIGAAYVAGLESAGIVAALKPDIESGAVDAALVDQALERVLRQKCDLGLLDADWSPEAPILRYGALDLDNAASRKLARRLASRSIVLLANDGTLPLPSAARIALIGPRAHDAGAMLGSPLGAEIPTLFEALSQDPAEYSVRYEQGCGVLGGEDEDIASAVRAAAESDVAVVALGDEAALFGNGTSGEGCDVADLRLPGRQEELLEAVLATGTPVVLVLLVGRPYELSRQIDRLAAVVCAFFPGEEGAPALADVLSGRVNPAGRLPVSFPGAGATTVEPTALFSFGHGLGYTSATWGRAALVSGPDWPTDGTCQLSVRLRNDSNIETSEVVQVYLHDPVAEVARPVRKLIAAPRIDLAPGASRTVRITLHADLASFPGRDLARAAASTVTRVVEPGDVQLHIGASSTGIRVVLDAALTGPRREVGADRVLFPEVSVS